MSRRGIPDGGGDLGIDGVGRGVVTALLFASLTMSSERSHVDCGRGDLLPVEEFPRTKALRFPDP